MIEFNRKAVIRLIELACSLYLAGDAIPARCELADFRYRRDSSGLSAHQAAVDAAVSFRSVVETCAGWFPGRGIGVRRRG